MMNNQETEAEKSKQREIEVKARITDFDTVTKKLETLGCVFSESIQQEDTVYLPKGVGIDDVKKGVNALRIRKENNTYTLTLKQRQELSLDSIEKELVITDPRTMEEIITLLGFYTFQTVTKTRKKCNYNNYLICLDEVEGLGKFIEVEQLSSKNGGKTQEEMFQFLETLGIKRENRATRGYDILLYKKLHEK